MGLEGSREKGTERKQEGSEPATPSCEPERTLKGPVRMAAVELERCVLSVLACRADPIPELQTAMCTGATARAPDLAAGTYEGLYLSGMPRSIREPSGALAGNWLPRPEEWMAGTTRMAEGNFLDFYPDYTYYRLTLEGDGAGYDLLYSTAASLPMQQAMHIIDVPRVMVHSLIELARISKHSTRIAILLGCAARNKDRAYFELIIKSERASKIFGPVAQRYDRPKYVMPWVSVAISAAGRDDKPICDLAMRYLRPYTATMSTIGCATHVVNDVLKRGGFSGHGAKLDYDVYDELVESALGTFCHNLGTLEHNIRALLSLYPKHDIASTFTEWIHRRHERLERRNAGSPANQDALYECIYRTTMESAAPFELHVTRAPGIYTGDAHFDPDVCKYVLMAGPIGGVNISRDTKLYLAHYTMKHALYLCDGKNVLNDKILEAIVVYTTLAGHVDQNTYGVLSGEIAKSMIPVPRMASLWRDLRNNGQFRKLFTGLPA